MDSCRRVGRQDALLRGLAMQASGGGSVIGSGAGYAEAWRFKLC